MKAVELSDEMDQALAVLRGFLYDESLDRRPIIVGYLTETEDIIELGIDQFLDQLQMQPQEQMHQVYRILYFKYRSWIVWNAITSKPFREVRRQCMQADRCADLLARIDSNNEVNQNNDQTDSQQFLPMQKDSSSLLPAISRHMELTNMFWYRPDSPNFFLCQRVICDQFEKMARRVRAHLGQYDDVFHDLFYPFERMHLTLCVFSLKDLSQVEDCFSLIQDTIDNMRRWMAQYPVALRGIQVYQERMLFVNAIQDSNLEKLIKVIKQTCNMAGFVTNVEGIFIPHVTLLKQNYVKPLDPIRRPPTL
ncbi:unnamed protein product [Echinostoma caproni]|uniref:AKAP7_NLS domain-containing protein n=1 Tax=Echinostoma caproni TaxID=27848 RepID=A0A183AGA9_9TREM|nr:unnamed protein product [Echinostoma caproni]